MKKINLTLLTPLILTLLLQGCLPDSLTKWKKDPPQKPVSSDVVAPVVDESGTVLPFTHPTYAVYGTNNQSFSATNNLTIGTADTRVKFLIDGTLNDSTLVSKFLVGCSLVQSGNITPVKLPAGLKIDANDCTILGKPTANTSVTTPFCSDSQYSTQTACESAPLWNSSTNACTAIDYFYTNPSTGEKNCKEGYNKWYAKGDAIPYRIKLRYKNSAGSIYEIFATATIGVYSKLNKFNYTQSEKLLLSVTAGATTTLKNIVPVRTVLGSADYVAANKITATNGNQGIANFIYPSQGLIGIKRVLKMTLLDSTGFDKGEFVKTGATKLGRIVDIDTKNTNIIYLENASDDERYFSANDMITNSKVGLALKTTKILSIDDKRLFSTEETLDLDNDEQYFSSKMTLKSLPSSSYMVGKIIKPLSPIFDVEDDPSIAFTISPKLPDGLTFNEDTGAISGYFKKSFASTSFTVTAKNPLGSVSSTVKLLASDAPADLTYTTKQIITVSNTAFFTVGETLRQSATSTGSGPVTTTATATILKIINGYQMAIETFGGKFSAGASLDSGATYLSEKAFIIPDNSCVNTDYNTSKEVCEKAGYVWSTGEVFYSLALKLNGQISGVCSDPANTSKATCEAAVQTWTPTISIGSCKSALDGTIDATLTTQSVCENALKVWSPTRVLNGTNKLTSAQGVVSFILIDDNPTGVKKDVIYLSHTTGSALSASSAYTFSVGDSIYKDDQNQIGTLTIASIDSNYLKLTLAENGPPNLSGSVKRFVSGADVTGKDATFTGGKSGGYVYKIADEAVAGDNRKIFVSDLSFAPSKCSNPALLSKTSCESASSIWYEPSFAVGDTIYPIESVSADAIANNTDDPTTIAKVSHDILLVGERGKALAFNAGKTSSGNTTYAISPDLPSGLTLNSTSGTITGTAKAAMPRKDYVFTATNFVGQVSYVFSMEIRDYFSLTEDSNAQSFLLHKVGTTQTNRSCRINSADITANAGNLDVRCYLEGQEQDVHYKTIKLSASSGPGICEYIQYAPYYFWQYKPGKTSQTVYVKAGPSTCTNLYTDPGTGVAPTYGSMPTAGQCTYNYEANTVPGPNCDNGSFHVVTVTATADPSPATTCTYSTSDSNVDCGGDQYKCISGPVTDLLTGEKLKLGDRSVIYPTTTTAFSQSWEIATTPMSKNDGSNLRVANGNLANNCHPEKVADVNTWTKKTFVTSNQTSPLGNSNPYYVYNCLDAATKIKARIRLVIREWDKDFKVSSNIDQYNPGSEMDTPNSPQASTVDEFDYPLNTYGDWDSDYAGKGKCSISGVTDEYNCQFLGGLWKPRYCATTLNGTTAITPTPSPDNAFGCAAAGGFWKGKANYISGVCGQSGVCSDGTSTTSTACTAAAGTWTDGIEFDYPGQSL